jgi:cell division control protein 11
MMIKRQNRRFIIMAAGRKGSGKSSFFNTLIGKDIVKNADSGGIDIYTLSIDCDGVMQRVTLIDTPGFGMTLSDTEIQESIASYIKAQFNMFIAEESKIRRDPKFEDTRIHCLLYFISSASSGLKSTDIAFLKSVSPLVNIIPIISKADGLTINERRTMKAKVMEQLSHHKIPTFDLESQELYANPVGGSSLNELVPFLVVSADFGDPGTKSKDCQWGLVNIDNHEHCDFMALREILLSTHTSSLAEYTASELYENYRSAYLEKEARAGRLENK